MTTYAIAEVVIETFAHFYTGKITQTNNTERNRWLMIIFIHHISMVTANVNLLQMLGLWNVHATPWKQSNKKSQIMENDRAWFLFFWYQDITVWNVKLIYSIQVHNYGCTNYKV